MKPIRYILNAIAFACLSMSMQAQNALAQNAGSNASWWSTIPTLDWILILIALLLLIPIYYFSKLTSIYLKKYLEEFWNRKINTTSIIILATLVMNQALLAQAAAGTPSSELSILRMLLLIIIVLEAGVIIFFTRIIWKAIYQEEVKTQTVPLAASSENWLSRWWKKSNNFIPIDQEKDLDTGHNYDGIRELDNNIPSWFSAAFILCILFAGFYLWQYHFAKIMPLQTEEYELEVQQAEIEHEKYLKTAGSKVDEANLALLDDKASLDLGKKYFIANCATCHVVDGGGNQGPNLTDKNWIYGCDPASIYKTIKYGGKTGAGMQAWKDNFSDQQILELASYVRSLGGSKPANPKAAQGPVCEYTAKVDSAVASVTSAPSDSIVK